MDVRRPDYNIGLEWVNCVTMSHANYEDKKDVLLDKMARCNVELTIIKDVINKLSHAKHNDKQADFSQDEEMKRHIVHIHKTDPTIFDSLVKNFPDYLPEDEDVVSTFTVDGVLDHSLKNVDMSRIHIDVLKEDQIDIIVQGLEGQIKSNTADLHRYSMELQEVTESCSHVMEIGKLGQKQDNEEKQSIIKKTIR